MVITPVSLLLVVFRVFFVFIIYFLCAIVRILRALPKFLFISRYKSSSEKAKMEQDDGCSKGEEHGGVCKGYASAFALKSFISCLANTKGISQFDLVRFRRVRAPCHNLFYCRVYIYITQG